MGQGEVVKVCTAEERSASVRSVALKRESPPVTAFDDLNVDVRLLEAIGLWVDFPCFC